MQAGKIKSGLMAGRLGLTLLALVAVCAGTTGLLMEAAVASEVMFMVVGAMAIFGLYCLWTMYLALGRGRSLHREVTLLREMEDSYSLASAIEDRDGDIVYANNRFRDWFPEKDHGLVGAIAGGLTGDPSVTPDDLIKLRMQSLKGNGGRAELSSVLPGSKGPRWFDISSFPLKDGLIAWHIREATERRRQIERAGDRLALLSRALDRAPFGIVVTDEDLTVREANMAFRHILDDQPAAGRNFLTLVIEEDQKLVQAYLDSCRKEVSTPLEGIDIRLAGVPDRTITMSAVQTTSGGEGGFLLHLLDVTERKRLEMQFAQSQKMQAVGQLAGGVAHDFNNMLTAIIGFCDLLLQRHQAGDSSFADAMQIKQNANRAAGLIRQLLAFSRQQTVRPRILNVSDILAELSILLRRLLGERIDLELIHGRDLGPIKMDQVQLEQVIINLAVNARDAMPSGGRLIIQTDNFSAKRPYQLRGETMPVGDYVMLSIADTGEGISRDDLDRIFEPFFTTKEVGEGTGLGLSMVFGSIRQAGGFVVAHSDGPGRGATFNIYLKRVAEEEMATVQDKEVERSVSDDTGGGNILLVEDEDAVRLFAARALRSKGYKVLEARTGEAAVEIIDEGEQTFDLLVTDMVMPRVDGATLIRHVRKVLPDLPVVCISGYTQDSVAKEVAELPNVHFLPKPFSLKQLATRVKDALDQQTDSQKTGNTSGPDL
ncbi:hybrid sensor histidine kinase/response regulator [Aestuariispira insulae]|uniref:histidine kinase n=1 Tax=Aestuariispira insulae TaxID=1461337 RepID=A0A3D9HSQ3_9PROT|nr:PAS domain-containing sensor histidine kinase [Aestuariispira insulae]RED52479.1 two-component system cell cycle sensor histidine kinase/response regulator CckA [Aestuariispira insulae]